MSTTTIVMMWFASAFVLMLVLVTMSVWYSRRHQARVEGHEGLTRVDRYIRWMRIGIVFIALTVVFLLLRNKQDLSTLLLAPAVWSFIVIIGLVGLDLAVLARTGGERVKRRLTVYLPRRLVIVVLLVFTVLGVGVWYGWRESTFDQLSYLVVWVKNGHTEWATRAPFAGWSYTYPLMKLLAVVLLVAIAAIFAVLRRPSYLPSEDFSALDRGFRRRTIRDIILAFTTYLAASTGIVAGNICWTVNSIGPDNIERAAVIVGAGAVAVWMLATTCWCLANLLLLPALEEDWRLDIGKRPTAKA